ncbi:MAG: hypothetical protein JSV88_09195 [Candidatus Aminicenantes bacterium]|nr:MAG: hypothetical protein JSV88_09195 [Candidatus Aminicenantes bacterium]
MSSEKEGYEITFKNNRKSKKSIRVRVVVGEPEIKFNLQPNLPRTESYTPNNNGILEFSLVPIDASEDATLYTHKFSTKHHFQFSKQKDVKKWKLTLDVSAGNVSEQPIHSLDDPPTNVEVGVEEPIDQPKQKPKGK